jgi:hypothetical protein
MWHAMVNVCYTAVLQSLQIESEMYSTTKVPPAASSAAARLQHDAVDYKQPDPDCP